MYVNTGDPVSDFEAYDADLHRKDHLYPVCEICGQPIYPGDMWHMEYKAHWDCIRDECQMMEERDDD